MLILGWAGVSSLLFGWFENTGDPPWAAGVCQRLQILSVSTWIFSPGLLTATTDRPRDRGQDQRRHIFFFLASPHHGRGEPA